MLKLLDNLFGALLIGVSILFSPLLRRWYLRWGATDDETRRAFPGDEIVPQPVLQATRAITIHAPPAQVWPWLAQIGQGRGGLYSYELLENLVGCQIHNADEILPQFQDLRAGDSILFMPSGLGQVVTAVEPGRALVMQNRDPKTGQIVPPEIINGTWAFILEAPDAQTTRLIARSRSSYPPTFANTLIWRIFTEPVFAMMERRMLLGIKARAEALPLRQTAPA